MNGRVLFQLILMFLDMLPIFGLRIFEKNPHESGFHQNLLTKMLLATML